MARPVCEARILRQAGGAVTSLLRERENAIAAACPGAAGREARYFSRPITIFSRREKP
jgi:hypothetical protein